MFEVELWVCPPAALQVLMKTLHVRLTTGPVGVIVHLRGGFMVSGGPVWLLTRTSSTRMSDSLWRRDVTRRLASLLTPWFIGSIWSKGGVNYQRGGCGPGLRCDVLLRTADVQSLPDWTKQKQSDETQQEEILHKHHKVLFDGFLQLIWIQQYLFLLWTLVCCVEMNFNEMCTFSPRLFFIFLSCEYCHCIVFYSVTHDSTFN